MVEEAQEASPKKSALGRVPGWLWALALYTGITVWRYAAVLRAPARLIIGGGDGFNYLWRIWWFAGGFKQWGGDMFFAPQLMYPLGHHLAEAELTPLNMVPAVLLDHLLGQPVLAYNLIVLASIVLSGLVTYAFARRLGAGFFASLLAGVVYAFGAYPMVHSLVHLPLMGIWTLPLALIAIEGLAGAYERGESASSRRWALLLGAAVGLAGWSSWYYLVMFGIAAATYGLVRLSPSRTGRARRPWMLLGMALLSTLVMVVPLYMFVKTHVGSVSMTWQLRAIWGAPFFAYLIPGALNPLIANQVGLLLGHTPGEDSLYLGWIAMILAVIGVVSCRKVKPSIAALLWSAGVAFVFSLGPRLYMGYWDNPKLGIALHGKIFGHKFLSALKPMIPLPAILVTKLPVFDGMRQYDRFGIVVLLCVAALCALGFDALSRKLKLRGVAVVVLFVVLLAITLFETSVFIPFADTTPQPVENWLAQQPGEGVVAWLPDWTPVEDEQIYMTRVTHKPIAFGASTFVPVQLQHLATLSRAFPSPQAVAALDAAHVKWIVWQKAQRPTPVVPGVYGLVASFSDVDVLERVNKP